MHQNQPLIDNGNAGGAGDAAEILHCCLANIFPFYRSHDSRDERINIDQHSACNCETFTYIVISRTEACTSLTQALFKHHGFVP